jgi:hypothetical protein
MTRNALVIVMMAGLAQSAAMAQRQQVTDTPRPAKSTGPHLRHSAPLRNGGTVTPIMVEVNGVVVPFSLVAEGADSQFILYDNINTGDNLFTDVAHHYRTLDDFAFAGGQSAVITGLRPAWGTPAVITVPTTETVVVEFQFYGTLNPAVTPVNGPPAGNAVRVTYGNPVGGWAVNTAYTGASFILHTAGNNPTVSSGAVDVRILRPTVLTPHPDFDPVFGGNGVNTGTGQDLAWLDLNNDNIYQGADAGAGDEGIDFGGLPGDLANLRLAIQGRYLEPTAGACCLPGGSCVVLTSAQCTGLSGTYNGDGTTCASVPGHCATAPVLHNNGPLSTGPIALNNAAAPAGTTWAEGVQEPPCTTNINGPNGSGTFRLADDFTVPSGKQWAINKITTFCYASPGTTTTSPITGFTLRIWDGPPNLPSSTVVFGNTTTNLYVASGASFSNMYRIFNTGILAQLPGTTRPIWKIDVPLTGVNLPAGTYWADWNVTGASFAPQVTMMTNATNGVRNAPAANALQFLAAAPAPNTGSAWQLIGESGPQAGCMAGHYDMPFILEGAETNVSTCYPNCDNSTTSPILNVQDFTCFLQRYAAGDTYANCDNSTTPPILNVQDFTCFLQSYAAGCP